jgi:hypothetical protein
MNTPWAAVLEPRDARSLAQLRLTPGIEVAEVEDSIWLRGASLEPLEMQLRGAG